MVVGPGSARQTFLLLVAVVVAGLGLALAPPAHAYVRSRADSGIPKYWQKSCIPVTVYQNGFADMSRDEVAKSIAAAAHTWSPTAVTCPDGVSHPFLEIVTSIAPEGALPPTPAYDGLNTLLFYTYDRPYPPPEVSGISPSVVALTSTWARADGHIVDADVRVNARDNFFANLDPGSTGGNGQSPFDLQNALTHEFGHLIGLGHTCWSPFSDPEQPIDDQGVPAPYCSGAPEELRQTVMFAIIDGNREITKRTLSADDIRAVCDVYPEEQIPTPARSTCRRMVAAAAPPGPSRPWTGLALLAGAGVVLVMCRRARRAGRG